MISPGMGIGSFFLKRSLRSLMIYRNTVHTSPIMSVTTLVLAMFLKTASMLWGKNKMNATTTKEQITDLLFTSYFSFFFQLTEIILSFS